MGSHAPPCGPRSGNASNTSGHFAPADATLVASGSRYLAERLRRAMLLTALCAERHDHEESAGLVLLAADNSITQTNAPAETWLAELRDTRTGEQAPPAVIAVASRARAIAQGRTATGAIARARVRTASGLWLLVRGSTLRGDDDAQTAVMLEPARPHELSHRSSQTPTASPSASGA